MIERSRLFACILPIVLLPLMGCEQVGDGPNGSGGELYTTRAPALPDGSGKIYMEREIASVGDGDEHWAWLERPGRETEELPMRVVRALELQPDDVVADIGAGTGYFTFRFSREVPEGRVLAVDIQEEMLARIQARMQEELINNVELVKGSITDPNLPKDAVDVAIIISSYHEFSHPYEMMQGIYEALKPGGRFVLVEHRGEDPTLPMSTLRRMTEAQAIKEMRAVGLTWKASLDILPQQHFMVFQKPFGQS